MSRVVARGRGLAIVDGDVAVVFGEMDHHEAAAADIAGARIGDRERKAGRDRGIDRIAAAFEDLDADARGAASCATTMPLRAVTGVARRNRRRARDRRDLRGGERRAEQQRDDE